MTTEEIIDASFHRVNYALEQWEKAPYHVRSMAGAYMTPVLEALKGHQKAIRALQEEIENGKA